MKFPRAFAPCSAFAAIVLIAFWLVSVSAQSGDLNSVEKQAFQKVYALQDQGNWSQALTAARDLTQQIRERHGKASRFTLAALNEVAIAAQESGAYRQAIDALQQASEITISLGQGDSAIAAKLLTNLSGVQQTMGNFSAARKSAERSIEIWQRSLEAPPVSLAHAKNNLGNIHWTLGDFAKAETLFTEAAQLATNDANARAIFLSNRGGVKIHCGEDGVADLKEAFEYRQRQLGNDHPKTLETTIFLGEALMATGQYEDAARIFLQCFQRRQELFGAGHIEVAEAAARTGEALLERNQIDQAREFFNRSIADYRKAVGDTHIDLHRPLYGAAVAAFRAGDRESAGKWATALAHLEEENLRMILRFSDERERAAFLDLVQSPHLHAQLGDAQSLAHSLLNTDGLVFDSLLRERRMAREAVKPEMVALAAELHEARAGFRDKFLGVGGQVDSSEIERAIDTIAALERRLLAENPLPDPGSLTVDDLCRAQSKERFLSIFFEYQPANADEQLGALIATSAGLKWLELGNANKIHRSVDRFLAMAARPDQDHETEIRALSASLHQTLVAPILDQVGTQKEWLIVPGNALAFLPFGCLLDEQGQFAINQHKLRYLSHPREALQDAPTLGSVGGSALVLGNPAYAKPVGGSASEAPFFRRFFGENLVSSIARTGLSDLPGALAEAELIYGKFRNAGLATDLLTGDQATEAAFLTGSGGRRILHIATHGMYLGRSAAGAASSTNHFHRGAAAYRNPMFQGCIALAGIDASFAAWAQERAYPTDTDGVFMAHEAAALNLSGCDLVTLSACESGLGEAHQSAGIMGLRRGFRMAGAEHLLATLWVIDDNATVSLMEDFYDDYLRNGNAAAALNKAKRNHLAKHLKETGSYHHAVFLSGPFILSR